MMPPVHLAIVALVLLLGFAAAGIIIGAWLRPLLAKSDIVGLSVASRGRRDRPTIDRNTAASRNRVNNRAQS